MSILQKIREKTVLVLIIIGLGIALFVIDPSSIFTGQKKNETNVGVIDGENIDYQTFEQKVQEAIENYKNQQGGIDKATEDAIRNQTWEQEIQQIVLGSQYKELGLTVSTDELFDMVQGPNPHPQIRQAFSNPQTGEFSTANVISFLKKMEEDGNDDTKKRWIAFERDLKKQQIYTKYNTLIKKGLYVTTAEAKNDNVARNKQANIRFVAKRYAALIDTTIKVSDSEIEKYYAAHNYLEIYKQEEAVDLKYVAFELKPSDEDFEAIKKKIDTETDSFRVTTNDTLFINLNSDKPYAPNWLAENALAPAIDTLKKAPVGTVAGPYLDGDTWKVSKLLGTKMASDSAKVRHLLVAYVGAERAAPTVTRTKDQAKAMADSILALVKSKKQKLEDLVEGLTDDDGSKNKPEGTPGYKGDYGWFGETSGFVPEFKYAGLNGKKGNISVVETMFGYHIIEVLDKSKESRRLNIGTVEHKTDPTKKTYSAIFAKASDLSTKNKTLAEFDAAVSEQGLNVKLAPNIKPMEAKIAGLENPRELIKWAYNDAKKGEVSSKVFEIGNKYVVAVVVEKYEKGVKPIESIKEELEAEVRKEKKAEQLVKEFDAALTGTTSIDALGTKLNAPVEVAQNITFNAGGIANMGREPEVSGAVAVLKPGTLSKPIKGVSGVYVVVVDNVVEAPEVTDFTPVKKQLEQALSSRADNEVYEALKEKANIIDNRVKFY